MTDLEFRLLNDFQRGFPLCERPFRALAQQLGREEAEVLASLIALRDRGLVSRVGAVFRPGTVGVSTLAAMAVPAAQLDRVAATVSGFSEVNHNYEREHRFDLWFVVTAADQVHLEDTLQRIATAARLPVMSLPLQREYRIDLGFDLQDPERSAATFPNTAVAPPCTNGAPAPKWQPAPSDMRLVAALQSGLALVPRPYRELAARTERAEQDVIERLSALVEHEVIKRLGVVVRHRALGYVANAMVVFDVPDDEVDRAGARIAESTLATLCYRRARRLPDWPYNLFCMIHSRTRQDALLTLTTLRERCALAAYPHAVLFSRQCFKQRGARYLPTALAAYG